MWNPELIKYKYIYMLMCFRKSTKNSRIKLSVKKAWNSNLFAVKTMLK